MIITASTPCGLEAASVLHVTPSMQAAPQFISMPKISFTNDGKLRLDYQLNMTYEDQSMITWYRCSDVNGSNPIKVAVSRFDKPLTRYELTPGDVGYYLMAAVEPKHVRSVRGKSMSTVLKRPITNDGVKINRKYIRTDFRNFPTENQPEVLPGFWTLSSFNPTFKGRTERVKEDTDSWYYGEGEEGAKNMMGLLQSGYVQLFYTPVRDEYDNMTLTMEVAPFKTAGQGFSIAPLYMDVLIKFDAKTLTGYGLRFIRTTKYHDAVDCLFMKYEDGKITEISSPISTSCYRTPCYIKIEIKENKIMATAETTAEIPQRENVVTEVDMQSDIIPNNFGGFGIRYAGGSPTLIKELKVEWQ